MWPQFFPNNCPPVDAEPATGVVFRLTRGDIPLHEDFLSHRERFRDRDFENECEACGLSVYRDASDARRAIAIAKGFRKKRIAQGEINPDMGKIKHTPRDNEYGASHLTWWLHFGQEPASLFVVIHSPNA